MSAADSIPIHDFDEPITTRPHPLTILILFPSEMLTDNRPHGDGRLAWGYIRALADRGHTLHVAARNVDIAAPIPPNVFLYSLDCPGSSETLLERLKFMRSVRKLIGRLHMRFDLVHELNPVYRGVSLGLIDQHIPIVLGPYPPSWPSDADANINRGITRFLPAPLKRRLTYWQQSRASALLLMTPAAIDRLSNPLRERVFELPPGLDIDLFSPNPALHASAASILFLANLNKRKGIFTLLDSFALLRERMPDCRLTIAGGGPEYENVRSSVEKMRLSDSVEMLGDTPRESIPDLMAKHSVYCLPSYGEPLGISVLEAMACGRPIVITNNGGLRSIVSEEGGRLVPPRDPVALAAALEEILLSPSLQLTMGQHNRKTIVERFSWDRVADQLEQIYRSVLGTSKLT